MKLSEAIEKARECEGNPPPNEATTCHRVIDPVLHAIGYAPQDILVQGSDNQGQKPDYTILKGTPSEWFLEAKSWTSSLSDNHAGQALNYANQNGRRWVVLSNGKEWRLYDNDIRGTSAEKLVATARLSNDEEIRPFLDAISKHSVTSGRLESQAQGFRLSSVLDAQMKDANSRVVRAIRNAVNTATGLAVSSEDVVRWFEVRTRPPQPPNVTVTGKGNGGDEPDPQIYQKKSLAEWNSVGQENLRFRKPVLLEFPGGIIIRVGKWNEVDVELVKWIDSRGQLPSLPWRVGRSLLLAESKEAFHTLGSSPKPVDCSGRTVFVETAWQASNHLWLWKTLCEQTDVKSSEIIITLTSQSIPGMAG